MELYIPWGCTDEVSEGGGGGDSLRGGHMLMNIKTRLQSEKGVVILWITTEVHMYDSKSNNVASKYTQMVGKMEM